MRWIKQIVRFSERAIDITSLRFVPCHHERSEAESKDPAELPEGFATGFLDFARNDR